MKIQTLLLMSFVMLTLSACAYQQVDPKDPPLVKGKILNPKIHLEIKDDKLSVRNSKTPNCPGSDASSKGCIVTGLEDIAFATFSLKGSGSYYLTRLWVCEGGNKPTFRDPKDHDSLDCQLLGDRVNEFVVIIGGSVSTPDTNGSVELGFVREFSLLNQNSFKGEYFYLIKACKKKKEDEEEQGEEGEADCKVLDPRIRNGGRHVIP